MDDEEKELLEFAKRKSKRTITAWELAVFLLATIGAIELRNHALAGPLRSWWVDGQELTEAVLLLQEQLAQRGQLTKLPPELAASQKKVFK